MYFVEKFESQNHIIIQKELGESSWFGFSLIINCKGISRNDLIDFLHNKNIEVRPIVSGNFLDKEVLKYYKISSDQKPLINSKFVDKNGFFVGNHHYDIKDKIDYLFDSIKNYFKSQNISL